MSTIAKTLDVLRAYYADKDGDIYPLNDVQLAVYLDALNPCAPESVEQAARQWMRTSKWFPKVSDLLDTICPEPDLKALGLIAWAEVENAVKRWGHASVMRFENPELAEAVRRTFRDWSGVTWIESGSPTWAIKRQSFLAIFEQVMQEDREFDRVVGDRRNALQGFVGEVEWVEGFPEPNWKALRRGLPVQANRLIGSGRED